MLLLRPGLVWLGLLPLRGLSRVEMDKTPYPCKDKYAGDVVSEWVSQHLQRAKDGVAEPQLLLMLGGSGAGKGTFIGRWHELEQSGEVVSPEHSIDDFIFHGLDEYLAYIPEYQKTVSDPDNVYKDAADACYGGAAIPAAKLAGTTIISRKINAIYEETGKDVSRIKKRVLPPFTEAGYRITVVLIHNNADVAISRSKGRFQSTGRFAAGDYIRGTFKNNVASYTELKALESVSEAVYCDNSGDELKCWRDGLAAKLVPDALLREGRPEIAGAAVDEL